MKALVFQGPKGAVEVALGGSQHMAVHPPDTPVVWCLLCTPVAWCLPDTPVAW